MLQIIEAGVRTKDTSTVTDPSQPRTRTADEQPVDTGMTPKQTDLPVDPYPNINDGSDDAGDANDSGFQPTADDDTSEPAADTDESNPDWQPDSTNEQRTSSKLPWVVGGVALTGLVVWLVKRKKSQSQTHGWTPPRFRR